MTQITLDPETSNKLSNLLLSAELCDSSGRVIGRFIPKIDMSEWEPLEPQVSEEELGRREQASEKLYTTAKVLAYLEKL